MSSVIGQRANAGKKPLETDPVHQPENKAKNSQRSENETQDRTHDAYESIRKNTRKRLNLKPRGIFKKKRKKDPHDARIDFFKKSIKPMRLDLEELPETGTTASKAHKALREAVLLICIEIAKPEAFGPDNRFSPNPLNIHEAKEKLAIVDNQIKKKLSKGKLSRREKGIMKRAKQVLEKIEQELPPINEKQRKLMSAIISAERGIMDKELPLTSIRVQLTMANHNPLTYIENANASGPQEVQSAIRDRYNTLDRIIDLKESMASLDEKLTQAESGQNMPAELLERSLNKLTTAIKQTSPKSLSPASMPHADMISKEARELQKRAKDRIDQVEKK